MTCSLCARSGGVTRRLPVLIALLACAIIAALVLGPGGSPISAQTGIPAAGHDFVGSWRVTVFSAGSQTTQSLITLTADATLLNSDEPVSPGGGGFPATVSSDGHGSWQPTGETTASITFVELVTDVQGTFLGTATISARLSLGADGNSFSGPFTFTFANPSGKVVGVAPGRVQATRITVQPMATPTSGTPAA